MTDKTYLPPTRFHGGHLPYRVFITSAGVTVADSAGHTQTMGLPVARTLYEALGEYLIAQHVPIDPRGPLALYAMAEGVDAPADTGEPFGCTEPQECPPWEDMRLGLGTIPIIAADAPEAPRCPNCDSEQWVSVSLDEGYTRRAQCVPCGAYHPPVIGPGWKAPNGAAVHPAYRNNPNT